MKHPTAAVVPGRRIGRYECLATLGSGGMATVYLARLRGPRAFEKLVALKCLHGHLADRKDMIDMFLDEGRIAAEVAHPNVCTVFDCGQAGDTHYIAMELVLGRSAAALRDALAESPATLDARARVRCAVAVAIDVCEGLHAAHELTDDQGRNLGVVHRDVSAQNVLVGYDGVTRLLDFGVAGGYGRYHRTVTGEIKGTLAYMAPEQIDGESDRRADVWSIGVVLWELLTLRRLFAGHTTMETVFAVGNEPLVPPSAYESETPRALDEVVLRMLARDPAARFATAVEAAEALRQTLATVGWVDGVRQVADCMAQVFPEGARTPRALVQEMARNGERQAALASAAGVPDDAGAASRESGRRGLWIGGALAIAAGLAVVVGLSLGNDGRATIPTAVEASDPGVESQQPGVAMAADNAPVLPVGSDEAPGSAVRPPAMTEPPSRDVAALAEVPPKRRDGQRRRPAGVARVVDDPVPHGEVAIVVANGWANVYDHRGAMLGPTPLRTSLPIGSHELRLAPYGHEPTERVTVRVVEGQVARVVHHLGP